MWTHLTFLSSLSSGLAPLDSPSTGLGRLPLAGPVPVGRGRLGRLPLAGPVSVGRGRLGRLPLAGPVSVGAG
jgi:hypothetical protein